MRKILPHASGVARVRIVPPALLTLLAVLGVLATGCIPQHHAHVVGLKPETPSIKHEASDLWLTILAPWKNRLREVKETHIDTLRPTFRWERFPPLRHPLHPNVEAVTYELRLWKVGKEFSGAPQESGPWIGTKHDDYKYSWLYGCRDTDPGELVYSRQGIAQPEHTLETTLQPDSRYFWSVRAHFTLAGRRRATQWSEQLPHNAPVSEIQSTCLMPATFYLIHTP
jgi:hypothetical protein